MDHVRNSYEPRYLYDGEYGEDGPLGPPNEPIAGCFLLGAFVLCIDIWLLGMFAVGWLS